MMFLYKSLFHHYKTIQNSFSVTFFHHFTAPSQLKQRVHCVILPTTTYIKDDTHDYKIQAFICMNEQFYSLLFTDCALSFILLLLFLHLAKLSHGVPGIASWGIGHFIYSLGAVLIDSLSLDLSLFPSKYSQGALLLGGLLSCAGLILLCYAVISFATGKSIRTQKRFFFIGMLIVSLSAWQWGDSLNTNGMALSLNEIIFLIVLLFSLNKLQTAPNQLPARCMMLCALPLLYIYSHDFLNSLSSDYISSLDWVNLDLAIWFLFNFCMLMIASFKAAEGFRKAALQDPLTGILNRRGLRESLDLTYSKNNPMAMISLDLDHFKSINDSYGHEFGDCVLQKFSENITSHLEENDIFARMGGEEFLVVLQGNKARNAYILAECLRASTESLKLVHEGKNVRISASLGVAISYQHCDISTLMRHADSMLYHAKNAGRNQIKSCLVEPQVQQKILKFA